MGHNRTDPLSFHYKQIKYGDHSVKFGNQKRGRQPANCFINFLLGSAASLRCVCVCVSVSSHLILLAYINRHIADHTVLPGSDCECECICAYLHTVSAHARVCVCVCMRVCRCAHFCVRAQLLYSGATAAWVRMG